VIYDAGSGAQNAAYDIFQEAELLARSELARFRKAGDVKGQAAMLLAFAEVDEDRRQPVGNFRPAERQEAVDACREARALFARVGDAKMEGLAAMMQANLCYRMHDQVHGRKEPAFEFTTEALRLFRQAEDKKNEAKALHLLAHGHILRHEVDECMERCQEALHIYRGMDNWKLEASELVAMAEHYIRVRKAREAISLAEDAYDIYMDHEGAHVEKPMAAALECVVQAHILKGDEKRALLAAEDGVRTFQDRGLKRGEASALGAKATAQAALGEMEEAVRTIEEAHVAAQELGDPWLEAQILLDVATLNLLHKSYDNATQAAHEAIEIYQEQKDRQGEAFAMNKLNEIALAKDDWDTCMQISLEQRAIFQELEDKSRAASCYLTIAGLTGFDGKMDEAMPMIAECVELFQDAYDQEGEARALNFMAEFHSEMQDYDSAVEKAREMIEVLVDSGDKGREANAHRVLCNIHLKFDKPAHAVREANEALVLVKRTMDRRAIAEYMILVSNANVAVVVQDPAAMGRGSEKALRPAREAFKVAKTINNMPLMGAALLQVAQVQAMNARHGEAMQAAREAIEIFRTMGDKASEAVVVVLLAELHVHCMSPEKALDAANEGLAMAEEVGDDVTVGHARELIERIQGRSRVSIEAVQGMAMPTMAQSGPTPEAAPAGAGTSMEAMKPRGLDPEEVLRVVQEMARGAIGVDDEVFADSPLMDSGMDSLTAVSFRTGLQQNLDVKLPSSIVFDYPTMKQVANRIVELSMEEP